VLVLIVPHPARLAVAGSAAHTGLCEAGGENGTVQRKRWPFPSNLFSTQVNRHPPPQAAGAVQIRSLRHHPQNLRHLGGIVGPARGRLHVALGRDVQHGGGRCFVVLGLENDHAIETALYGKDLEDPQEMILSRQLTGHEWRQKVSRAHCSAALDRRQ